MTFRLLLLLLIVANTALSQSRRFRLPDGLSEVSGLYIAVPDSLWWLNDGGNGADLWLTDGRGKLRNRIPVKDVPNRDWEDLTADDQGRLYLGDFGNNLNKRQDLVIYIYQPEAGILDSILFDYPDQQAFPPPSSEANFDMEAFFWHDDSLHLFSKNRLHTGNNFTKHYVLPAKGGKYTASLRDSLYLKRRVVTGAAISPDGATVALVAYWFKPLFGFIPLTQTSVFLLEQFPDNHFLKGRLKKQKVRHCLKPRQFESIDFLSSEKVLIASERTIIFRQQGRRVKLK